MNLADIHELTHALSVGVVGLLVFGTLALLVVFFKLFERDLFGGD